MLLLLGGGCIALAFVLKAQVDAAESWTPVAAVITSSGTVPIRTRDPATGNWVDSEQPRIGFQYAVAGQTYDGSRYDANDSNPPWKALETYPKGAAVSAYYDPADPADAVLVNDSSYGFGVYFFCLFGTFVLLATGLVAFMAFGGRARAEA